MITINGEYSDAIIYADDAEDYAKAQVRMICDAPAAKGSVVRLMPDAHPGKVGPIGLTMTVGETVIPQLVGADIGCGITCVKLEKYSADFQKLDKVIREKVPSGFSTRKEPHGMATEFSTDKLNCAKHVNSAKAALSLGTLGGGNHFIEIDVDKAGAAYLMIHTGSRHLGEEVSKYYTDLAARKLKEKGTNVPYPMSYLEGDDLAAYLQDVLTLLDFAELNRKIIAREIVKGMKWKAAETFSCAHNFIDDTNMLRKGAISARHGERLVIPINMKDGVILGVGKGNADWNYSAPHGSGRKLKREDVKNKHTVSEFKKTMKGVYSTSIGADTLDEAPFAYRGIDEIASKISDTVEITDILKPVYNFKAGSKK